MNKPHQFEIHPCSSNSQTGVAILDDDYVQTLTIEAGVCGKSAIIAQILRAGSS